MITLKNIRDKTRPAVVKQDNGKGAVIPYSDYNLIIGISPEKAIWAINPKKTVDIKFKRYYNKHGLARANLCLNLFVSGR